VIKLDRDDYMSKDKKIAIITILLYFVYMFGAAVPLKLLGFNTATMSTLSKVIYSTIMEIILIIIMIFINIKDLKINWNDFKKNKKQYFDKYFVYWFKMLGLMVVANVAVTLITGDKSSVNEESIRAMMKLSKFYIVFSAVVYAPIVEELVFRKSIKTLIKNKWAFILTSGLAFGLIHCLGSTQLIEYLYVIPYAIPGCVFAYILYDSDNIFNTMSMHLWHNTIMVILELIVIGLGIV